MADELVDVLDEKGNKTGTQVMKSEAHKKGLWHAIAHVWIVNSRKEILLQKRSMDKPKDADPGKWDISMAGHVVAGEEPLVAAVRELEEELGVKVKSSELVRVATIPASGKVGAGCGNKFITVFVLKKGVDVNALVLQEVEVEEVKFVTFESLLKNCTSEDFVPRGSRYYEYLLQEIKENHQDR